MHKHIHVYEDKVMETQLQGSFPLSTISYLLHILVGDDSVAGVLHEEALHRRTLALLLLLPGCLQGDCPQGEDHQGVDPCPDEGEGLGHWGVLGRGPKPVDGQLVLQLQGQT